MELNWTTFLLELVNFLVLVWLLKRFLYKPVLDIINRRRQNIDEILQQAKDERQAGEMLKAQYENRLTDWEREREQTRQALQQELEGERKRQLDKLALELQDERKKQQVLNERQQQESARLAEVHALTLGAEFATQLLQRLAGPELETLLIKAAIEDLHAMPTEQREALVHAWNDDNGTIEVTSAHPLDQQTRETLQQSLAQLIEKEVHCDFHQSAELIGGIRLKIGYNILRANLQDELVAFVESAHD